MLNEDEISLYFSQLPQDLEICVNDDVYFVNKESVSILSGKIRSILNENSSSDKIVIKFSDPKNIFPLVVDFLQGQSIDINGQNVFYLQNAAKEFEIPSLENALKEELQKETCENNIVQRIIHLNENSDLLFDCIEDIIKNDDIFDLPEKLLVELIHSEKSKFLTESSRYLFAFECCKKFPDHTDNFITSEDIPKIPTDVISKITKDRDFQEIRSKLPNTHLALHLINKVALSRTQINEMTEFIDDQNEEIKEFQSENERIISEIERLKSLIVQNSNEFIEIKSKIENIKLGEISDIMQAVQSIEANEEVLNSYGSVLDQMDMIDNKISYYIYKMQAPIVVYHESRTQAKNLLEQMKAHLKSLHSKCAKLHKNDTEVSNFIQKMTEISEGIQKIIVDYFINTV